MSRQRRMSTQLYPRFVGREKELMDLKWHLEESMRGKGRMVLIEGEGGIGKSRLLKELGSYAQFKGILFLKGRCQHRENVEPYYPFIEAFDDYGLHDEYHFNNDDRKGLGGTDNRLISLNLLPIIKTGDSSLVLGGHEPNLQKERDRLFESLYRIVIDLSEKRPLLLALDDLHWADISSLQLLHYLARNIRNTKVLICGTCCLADMEEEDEKVHPVSETIRRMRIEKLFYEIQLKRLNEDRTTLMIESMIGRKGLPREFTNRLYEESGGNPFFIVEVLKTLVEEGLIDMISYGWDGKIDASKIRIPKTIMDVTKRRIERLDKKTKKILEYASAIGNSFSFEVLYRVCDTDEENVVDAIDAAIAAKIIREDVLSKKEIYKFDHTLTKDTIYDGMNRSRKRLLHKKIGFAMEEFYQDRIDEVLYNLAHHFNEGKDDEKAVLYAIRAAEKAAKSFAPEDALKYYRIALSTLNRIESSQSNMKRKLTVAGKLGDIHNMIGEWEKALEYHDYSLELSKKLGNDLEIARSYRSYGHIKQNKGEYDSAHKYFNLGLAISERIEDVHGMADTYRGLGRVYWRKGEFERAIVHFEKSLNLTENIEDKRIMATTCIELGNVYSELGKWDKAIEYQKNSLKLLENIYDFYEIGRSYNNIGVTYARKGDMEKAIEHYEKSIEISDKTGNTRMVGWALFNAGEAYARLGQFDKAFEYSEKSLSIFERLDEKIGISGAYMSYGIIYKLRKQWDKAIRFFDKSIVIREELKIPYRLADCYFEFGLLYKEKGDDKKAKEYLEKSREILNKLGARDFLNKIDCELKSINVMK